MKAINRISKLCHFENGGSPLLAGKTDVSIDGEIMLIEAAMHYPIRRDVLLKYHAVMGREEVYLYRSILSRHRLN